MTRSQAPRYAIDFASAYDAAWRTVQPHSHMSAEAVVGRIMLSHVVEAPGRHIFLKSASAQLNSAVRAMAYLRCVKPAAADWARTAGRGGPPLAHTH